MPKYEYTLPPHKVEHATLPLDTLLIDPQAQRAKSMPRIKRLATHFMPQAAGTLVVSERDDGSRYLVDGMHRREAGVLAGVSELPCEIHYGLTQQDEAQLFLIKNREGTKPSAADEYHIGLTAGLPIYVDTQSVLEKMDLKVGNGTSANQVGAIAGVINIVDRYDAETLERTLRVAEMAWSRDKGACWDGTLVGGLGMFVGRHPEVDDIQLAEKIGRHGNTVKWIGDVMGRATMYGQQHAGGGGRVGAMYHLVVEVWNIRRRSGRVLATQRQ